MTFTSPLHLWALLVLPVLWWLSLPARPRARTLTPHLAQWRAALAALRRRPPRASRWRFVLLALAAVAAIAAFARPVWRGGEGASRLVVVLDASASMAARDASGASAWQRATAAVQRTFATLPPHVDVTLLRAGGPLLRRHGASARSLHDLGEPAGALGADLAALAAAAAQHAGTAVWTLTDGQGQARLPDTGALTMCAANGANAAVLAVRLDDRWPLPQLGVEVDVVAHTAATARAEITLAGAATAAPIALELEPGVVRTVSFACERAAAGGELLARIAIAGDVLAADDTFALALPPLPAPRIAVLAEVEGDTAQFAKVAAAALAAEVGGDVVATSPGTAVGFLLVDGGQVALAAGRTRAIVFGAAAPGAAPEPWRLPTIADWDRRAGWLQGLDLSELRIERAWRGVLPPGEAFLWADVAGQREPLAVIAGTDGSDTASVHFAFRLQDGNLPLLAAFPQLLRRAFVRAHGVQATPREITPPRAVGEQDLLRLASAAERPLPPFAAAPRDLSAWCLVLGLCALALRAFVR